MKEAMSKKDQADAKKSERRLAAAGRGTNEELGVPIAGDRLRLENGRAGLDLNQNNNGSCNRDGRGCMEQDAEGAVVGIGIDRMHVRHLDYGEERQQDKTHDGDHRQSEQLCAAFSAEVCLKCCQTGTSHLRIHKI
jgi:hypothetical protein